jgi:four helix bundle protein
VANLVREPAVNGMGKVKGDGSVGPENFSASPRALELFGLTVHNLIPLAKKPETARLVSQQIASADSIAAGIEEGCGRGNRTEYARFLIFSRGSAQETLGRFHRLRHRLPEDGVEHRRQLCQEIIAILSVTIKTLRSGMTRSFHFHLHSHSASRGDARRCAA